MIINFPASECEGETINVLEDGPRCKQDVEERGERFRRGIALLHEYTDTLQACQSRCFICMANNKNGPRPPIEQHTCAFTKAVGCLLCMQPASTCNGSPERCKMKRSSKSEQCSKCLMPQTVFAREAHADSPWGPECTSRGRDVLAVVQFSWRCPPAYFKATAKKMTVDFLEWSERPGETIKWTDVKQAAKRVEWLLQPDFVLGVPCVLGLFVQLMNNSATTYLDSDCLQNEDADGDEKQRVATQLVAVTLDQGNGMYLLD